MRFSLFSITLLSMGTGALGQNLWCNSGTSGTGACEAAGRNTYCSAQYLPCRLHGYEWILL
ncbi:hypothetical protein C7974DRAFT_410393 [Boeremia exigua]|uniref:uncharacterized protein n=1 Tax=Boeremia exigua TaxID=749465 RepID=UPI001E8DE24B|nr:uncharacterized protein C7974DRAFT_410393 [Boeremia exigua]KAH6639420.1 hypothetical protein C7974DRAFT_410393 [Boeremia exigua]